MIIDSHCHAWENWPYDPSVPDNLTRGSLDQLVYEMDRNDVDRAMIVCAEIQVSAHHDVRKLGLVRRTTCLRRSVLILVEKAYPGCVLYCFGIQTRRTRIKYAKSISKNAKEAHINNLQNRLNTCLNKCSCL